MKKSSNKSLRSAASELGSRGGKALLKKRGNSYMKLIAKRGGEARWASRHRA